MIFEIKTKEIILPNGESDGYETIDYMIENYIVAEFILDLIEKHYGEQTRKFVEDFNILDNDNYLLHIADSFEDELDEMAQKYYDKEVLCNDISNRS